MAMMKAAETLQEKQGNKPCPSLLARGALGHANPFLLDAENGITWIHRQNGITICMGC